MRSNTDPGYVCDITSECRLELKPSPASWSGGSTLNPYPISVRMASRRLSRFDFLVRSSSNAYGTRRGFLLLFTSCRDRERDTVIGSEQAACVLIGRSGWLRICLDYETSAVYPSMLSHLLDAVGPALLDAVFGPDFVSVFWQLVHQQLLSGAQFDVRQIQRRRLVAVRHHITAQNTLMKQQPSSALTF